MPKPAAGLFQQPRCGERGGHTEGSRKPLSSHPPSRASDPGRRMSTALTVTTSLDSEGDALPGDSEPGGLSRFYPTAHPGSSSQEPTGADTALAKSV